jgi:hypothetical protein
MPNPCCWKCAEEIEPAPDEDGFLDGAIVSCPSCDADAILVVMDDGSMWTDSPDGEPS